LNRQLDTQLRKDKGGEFLMPRYKQDSGSAYERLREQAVAALSKVRKDIRTIESELSSMRRQEEQIGQLAGDVSNQSNGADAPERRGGRMDWRAVLAKLPKRFKASDVRKVRGLANKPSGEIFGAVTRWIDAGMVKRKERGVYERV
jgi:hypothetical protein